MIVTETEARTKWCPFVRVAEAADAHKPTRKADGYRCIASACMAWEFVLPPAGSPQSDAKGFCGLIRTAASS